MTTLTHNWIDAHCHLADACLESNRETLLNAAREKGITRWVQGGIGPKDWKQQASLKAKYGDCILTCFGLHPWWVAQHSEKELEDGLTLLKEEIGGADALGELGLDGMEKFSDSFSRQRVALERQLLLLKSVPRPVVLHVVKKHAETVEILTNHRDLQFRGIVHSFSGNLTDAKKYYDLGFLISISGTVTRPGNSALKEVIQHFPLTALVIETDAPDQPPYEKDGVRLKSNPPANLYQFASCVGEIKGCTAATVLDQSKENLGKIFGKRF